MGRAVPVEQIDLATGRVITTHLSTHAAAAAVGKAGGAGNILNVANGKSKSAYGFRWRYQPQEGGPCTATSFENEQWREFQGIQVSSYGRIRRTTALGEFYIADPLPVVSIGGKRWAIHRLVAHVFLGMPDDPSISVKVNGDVPSVKNIVVCNKKRGRCGVAANPKAAKRVQQWSIDGTELLKEYSSVSEAAKDLKMSTSHICKCASGKEKTAGGYTWQYASPASPTS